MNESLASGGQTTARPLADTSPSTTTHTYLAPRRTIRLTIPDGWARAVFAGLHAVFIAWALLACASVAAYSTVASNPWIGAGHWKAAIRLGSDLLSCAFGAPLTVDGVTYSAVPTLFCLIIVGVLRLFLRSCRGFPPAALWFSVPAFSLGAFFFIVVGASYTHWWHASVGALSIPLLASAWAYVDAKGGWKALCGGREWLRAGIIQGLVFLVVTLVLSAAALTWTVTSHLDAVKTIHALLLTDSATADALIVTIQTLYAPTWIAWALAWLSGPGVWVGVDTLHSPASAPVAAIPPIPILGALPTSTPGMGVILVPIVVAGLLGVLMGRFRSCPDFTDQMRAGAVSLAVFAALLLAWLPTSVLRLGVERMNRLGPDILQVCVAVFFEVGVVCVLTELCVHPRAIAYMRTHWRMSRLRPGQMPSDLLSAESQSCALGDDSFLDEGGRAACDELERTEASADEVHAVDAREVRLEGEGEDTTVEVVSVAESSVEIEPAVESVTDSVRAGRAVTLPLAETEPVIESADEADPEDAVEERENAQTMLPRTE